MLPQASRSSRLPSVVPSVTAACFWLVVVLKIMRLEAAESHDVFFIIYFFVLLSPPQTIAKRSPPTFHRGHTPSPISSPQQMLIFGWLLCFPNPNGSQLRLRPRPPHCFLMGCISAPKTREPTVAPPNPKARAVHGSIGSGGAIRAKRGDSPTVALTTRDSYSPDVALTVHRGFARCRICCGASNSAKDPGLPLA